MLKVKLDSWKIVCRPKECDGLGNSPKVVSAAKLPILNPNEFDLWKMRIEQYFLMTDHSLWEVILNGDSPTPIRVIEALPDKHQLKFNTHKDAKTLMESIEKRFRGNTETKKVQKTLLKQQYKNFSGSSSESLDQIHDRPQKLISQLEILGVSLLQEDINLKFLRSLPSEWRTHTLIWRNKIDLEEQSLDDFTNEPVSVAASVLTVSAQIHVSPLLNVDSLSNDVIYLFFASQSNSPQLDNDTLKQIDTDDLEEMDRKRQMAMLIVECYNCHIKGHFARECSYDWSFQVEEEPTNYALMAFSLSSSSFDNELRDNALVNLRQYLDKAEQERDDLKLKNIMPPKPDLVFNTASNNVETDHPTFNVKLSPTKPDQDLSHTNRPSAHIIEDWVSDSEDESDTNTPQNVPSFVQPTEQVKSLTLSVQHVETSIPSATSKTAIPKPTSNGKCRNRKECFVCKSLDHLIKDLLTQSKLVPITAVRPVSTDVSKIKVTRPRPDKPVVTKTTSPPRRLINCSPSPKASTFPPKVTAVKAPMNRVLVTKPHNKTLYELLHGRTPSIDFMRPFGCLVTILNTLDSLGKFNGKVDEGFLVGYSVSSKAVRVFNSRTRIVQETLHVNFMENNPNVTGNQSNPSAGFQDNFDAEKAGEESIQQYVLFPVWSSGSTSPHNTDGDATFDAKEPKFEGRKPESEVNVSSSSSAQSKKHDDKTKREAKGKSPVESLTGYRNLSAEFKDFSDNNINEDNASGTQVPIVGQLSPNNTNTFSAAELEDITYSDDEDDVGAEADFNNLETSIIVSPISTTRVHKDHPVTQIIVDLSSATQTKSAFLYGTIEGEVYVCQPPGFEDPDYPDKIYVDDIIFSLTNKDLCKSFKKLMKDKFQMSLIGELTFSLGLQVKQKKDEIFISQDKYVAEILRKFGLTDRKSASTPIDTKKPLLKDPDGEDVDVHTYRSMIGLLMYLTSSRPDIMFVVCACAHFHVTPKALHLHAVKRIFRYLKGKPHLGLWYPKDSPFDLVAYLDSDYAGASLDRKSTTGGCQFLGCRLISWQCKKQTVVATSSTKAEYVAAASCCAQVLWIQNQLLDYGPDQTVSGKDSLNPLMADNFQKLYGVNTPRCDEDRLKLMELTVFLLPSVEKVGVEVSAVDLQVSAVRLILLLLVQKFLLFGLTNWYCSLNVVRSQINPNIYVSCIKQFWTSAAVKKVNDVTRLQALVDKKKVVITEALIRDALRLDDAEGVECLPNEDIFIELARMGYGKSSTKLTFYKAFFSSQWKFLIHTILQCKSAKQTSWNEFSSSMASTIICLSSGRNFNFSKKQVGVLSLHSTKYTSPALTQKVFAIMRRVELNINDVPAVGVTAEGVVSASDDVVPTTDEKPSIPSLTPPTLPPQPSQALTRRVKHLKHDKVVQALEITKLKSRVKKLERRNKASKLKRLKRVGLAQRFDTSGDTVMDDVSKQGGIISTINADEDVVLEVAKDVAVEKSADVEKSVDEEESEPAELQELVDVVTTAKIVTEFVTAASDIITAASTTITVADVPVTAATIAAASTLTTAPSRRRKGVRKKKEDKAVKRYQALKRKPQTEAQARNNMMLYLKNVAGFKMDYFKGITY
nr:hypothetical protein [Tanacetum cinerariifolium]